MKNKAVVLLSGGVDSVTALYHTAAQGELAAALSFDYGSKHNAREIEFAGYHSSKLGIPHHVIPLQFMNELFDSALLKSGADIPEGDYADDNMKATVVPFRNGIMLSIACGYAESISAEAVVIGAHAGDHDIYPDCREDFMRAFGAAMTAGTYAGIELVRPFISFNKAQIVARGVELGVDYGQTWSCYNGRELHCGKCGTCIERSEAFLANGLVDPVPYES